MSDCVFCKIIAGQIPAHKIYEDESTLAFLDISQDAIGHTLVIPKTHSDNLLECDEQTAAALMATVRKISKYYVDKCGYEGINIINNNGKSAHQSVFHTHIHIYPRRAKDKIHLMPNLGTVPQDLAKVREDLKLI